MRQELRLKDVRWVKFTSPSEKEIKDAEKEFNIHPLVAKELYRPTIRSKVESFDNHSYMVIHVPVFESKDRKTYAREVDFVLLNSTIITVTYQEIKPITEFWNSAKKNGVDSSERAEAGYFLYNLLHHLFIFALRQLDHIQENIDTIEDIMFYGENEEIAKDIYLARRDLIDFRRALKPQEATLRSLVDHANELYGKPTKVFFLTLVEEYLRVWDILTSHTEAMKELYETNESIVASKINRTMKVFTILAFITFIPNIITNVFGMQIPLPYQRSPEIFWIIMGSTAAITICVYLYFRSQKML